MKNIKSHLESLKSEADSNENAGGQADIDSTFQGGVQHWNMIDMILRIFWCNFYTIRIQLKKLCSLVELGQGGLGTYLQCPRCNLLFQGMVEKGPEKCPRTLIFLFGNYWVSQKKRTFRMLLKPQCTGSITRSRHPLCLEINFLVVSY